MSGLGPFSVLAIGLIAGWIAQRVVDKRLGLWPCLLLGALGAVLGSNIALAYGIVLPGALGALALSTTGAIFLIAVYVLIRRGR